LSFASDMMLVGSTWPWSLVVSGVDRGTIPGGRSVQITNALVLAFFQKHLLGQSTPLLDGGSGDFPEIEFTTR
jgi:hypothetical protein